MEKAERSDIPDIDKKKLVGPPDCCVSSNVSFKWFLGLIGLFQQSFVVPPKKKKKIYLAISLLVLWSCI